MKRTVFGLAVLVGLWAALPAAAQQMDSNFNGGTVTNNLLPNAAPRTSQLTATAIIQNWISSVGTGISNLFSTKSTSDGLFSTTPTAPPNLPMSYIPNGPCSVPNPLQMTSAQHMAMFGIQPLLPNK